MSRFAEAFFQSMEPPPCLNAGEVTLSPLRREDAEELWRGTGDREVVRLEPWGPYTLSQTETMLDNILQRQSQRKSVEWAIRKDERPVGLLHLNHLNLFDRTAEIGYWLVRDVWGRGYATAAVGSACEAAANVGLKQIDAVCHPENGASLRVLEKNGFTLARCLPDYIRIGDRTWDGLLLRRTFSPCDFP